MAIEELSLGAALGLAGSLHCAGMCGPIALAISLSGHARRSHLLYHAGRIGTYSALGGVAGALGHRIAHYSNVQSAAAIGGGILMVLAAVVMFGTLGRPQLVQITPAASLTRGASRLLTAPSAAARLGFGFAMGLIPCGMIYAALMAAMASGTISGGAAFMAGFGFATAAPLLTLGIAASAWGARLRAYSNRLTPAAVGILGLVLVVRGLMPSGTAHH